MSTPRRSPLILAALLLASGALAEDARGPLASHRDSPGYSEPPRDGVRWSALHAPVQRPGSTPIANPVGESTGPSWAPSGGALATLLGGLSKDVNGLDPAVVDPSVEQRVVRRAFRRNAARLLRSALDLDDVLHRDGDEVLTLGATGAGAEGVRFRVGVSRFAPKLEIQAPLAEATLGVSLSSLGKLAADLRMPQGRTELHAGYDHASKSAELHVRVSF